MSATEKVINDLSIAKLILCNPQMLTPEMYIRIGQAITSAIALLKEQEPRVLTLEEAKTYEVVWPEDKGEGELHPLIVQNNMNDSKYYKYGIHWRVWSAKPTDEQRKAVKWDD